MKIKRKKFEQEIADAEIRGAEGTAHAAEIAITVIMESFDAAITKAQEARDRAIVSEQRIRDLNQRQMAEIEQQAAQIESLTADVDEYREKYHRAYDERPA